MITLPTVALTGDADAATAASGAKGGDAAQNFLALLGERLSGELPLADGKTLTLAQLTAQAKTPLAAGLDASTQPADVSLESLMAKLLPGGAADETAALTEGKTLSGLEKSGDNDATKPLSDADLSALSALFAMLPQTPALQQAAKASTEAQDNAISLNAAALNAAQLTLPAATPANSNAKADVKADTAKADGSRDARIDPLNLSAASADAVKTATANAVAPVQNSEKSVNDGNSTHALTALSHASAAALNSATQTPGAATSSTAPQVTAPLGTPAWEQSVSQHVTLFTRQGQQSAELRLHPEDLGAVQISLKIDDNTAQLQMVSPHSHVRAALEAALPTLRAQLAESGIQLGQSSISSDSSAAGQQQANQQQQQGSGSRGGFSFSGAEEDAVAAPVSLQSAARGNNAVDIFA